MARRYLMIGTGPAAVSAAEEIRRADPGGRIVALSGDAHGYYSRPGLAYLLADDVPEKCLHPLTSQDFRELDVEVRHDKAVAIDPAAHTVALANGGELGYDCLLVATGSSAMRARIPGADLDGVVKLDDLDDAHDLIRRCRGRKTGVVAGGGITALEIVEGMRARGTSVHYLMRRDRYWSDVLSESESRIIESELRSGGVQVHTFSELVEILGAHGRVTGVRTASGEEIACDMVGIAIGVMPRIELAEEAGIECGRGILVDRFMRTSAAGVFAAGDVAEVRDDAGSGRGIDVLWASAVAKGRVAGHNMAAEPEQPYRETEALNVSRLAGIQVTIIGAVGHGGGSDLKGISRGDSQRWRDLGDSRSVESQEDGCHVRLEIADGTLVGAVVMGDQRLSFPLQELIESRADLREAEDALRAPGASVARIVDRLWEERAQRV